VEEMLTYRTAASSAVRGYCEDSVSQIQIYMRINLFSLHHDYLGLLWRTMPSEGPARTDQALRLCKLMGLVRQTIDEVGDDWLTPLKRAAKLGAGERSLQCLVAAGAELNPDGWTPLMSAAQNGHAAAIEAMVRLGADLNRVSNRGATALLIAAMTGQVAAIEALGRLGANLNIADNDGCTPMFMAAQNGHAAAIEALGRLGADPNLAHNDGRTSMWQAAQNGHAAAIEALHKAGADINKPFQGWSPLKVSRHYQHCAIVTYLEKLGAAE